MKVLETLSRLIVGLVFLFSAYVKAVDPLGMYYKIGDYLIAYNLDFLQPLGFLAAVSVIALEMMLGFAFLFNLYMRYSATLMLVVESFFTILTFISWQTNAVSDCGCFGDAVVISNAETFWKNVFLMIPVVFVWLRRRKTAPYFNGLMQTILVAAFLFITLGFQWFNLSHLPIHDFRPYRIGTDLKAAMTLPADAKPDVYNTVLVYEKDGQRKEFTEDNFPWQDTTWVWVETRTDLVEEGDKAPIHNFTASDSTGTDQLPALLDAPGFKLILVAYDLKKASEKGMQQSAEMARWAKEHNVGFYAFTASTPDQIRGTRAQFQLPYNFLTGDGITYKTIVRANPGYVLLKGSTVMDKWNYRQLNTEALHKAIE